MTKPYKFSAIHNVTDEIKEYNSPMFHPREEWQEIEPGISVQVQMWTVYENTRYEAAKRLYNYVTYTKQGKQIPKYRPFAGTEIGKTIPILNF